MKRVLSLGFAAIAMIAGSAAATAPERTPERLQRLLQQLDAAPADSPQIESLRAAIDAEAGQRYGWASRLFWHTDLEQAKAAAAKSQKPILSLRLLGKLTDELTGVLEREAKEMSCANSRFFRTVLYANSEISKQLRSDFILHWSSERPVPVLTVDFGDGRVMKRTVTGNSIHYLLDASGQPLDAMPGLVAPKTFSHWLSLAKQLGQVARSGQSQSRSRMIRQFQQNCLMQQSAQWQRDLAKLRKAHPDLLDWTSINEPGQLDREQLEKQLGNAVAAERAVAIATPKRATEIRFIPMLTMSGAPLPASLEKNEPFWNALAELYLPKVSLDEASLALIAHQRPHAYRQGEDAVTTMLAEFQKNLARDTVRNQHLLQRRVRRWLLDGAVDLTSLNRRVYSELFLTPRQDPYLGLLPSDAYSGLENSGLSESNESSRASKSQVSSVNSPAGG